MLGIGSILTSLITWLVAKFGKKAVKITLMTTVNAGLVAVALSFAVFVISAIATVINIVTQLFDAFSSISSSETQSSHCIAEMISYAISCSGAIEGLTVGLTVLGTSITVILLFSTYKLLLKMQMIFSEILRDSIRLI
jgi:hypothetical protein